MTSPNRGESDVGSPTTPASIGKAYREGENYVARRVNDDYEAYVRELIRDWNYTEQRARLLNPGAMAWMAVPLMEDRRVEAILYLDVNQREFFTAERQELVFAATRGIAVFIGRRYS